MQLNQILILISSKNFAESSFYILNSIVDIKITKLQNVFSGYHYQDIKNGVQRRMISVDNFFGLLRLLIYFALLLLYVT